MCFVLTRTVVVMATLMQYFYLSGNPGIEAKWLWRELKVRKADYILQAEAMV